MVTTVRSILIIFFRKKNKTKQQKTKTKNKNKNKQTNKNNNNNNNKRKESSIFRTGLIPQNLCYNTQAYGSSVIDPIYFLSRKVIFFEKLLSQNFYRIACRRNDHLEENSLREITFRNKIRSKKYKIRTLLLL